MAGVFCVTWRGELVGVFRQRADDDPSVVTELWDPPEGAPDELEGWPARREVVALGEGVTERTNGMDDLDVLHLRALALRSRLDGIDTLLDDAEDDPGGSGGIRKAFDPNQPRDEAGRFAGDGGSGEVADVLAAPLRGQHGRRPASDIRKLFDADETAVAFEADFGENNDEFRPPSAGDEDRSGAMQWARIEEKNRTVGAYEEPAGHVREPSIHGVVRGQEEAILKAAAGLGRKYGQDSVAVCVRDAGAEGRVMSVAFGGAIDDEDRDAIMDAVIGAGLPGASFLLDKAELKLLATDEESAARTRRVIAEAIPGRYGSRTTETAARVRFVGHDEYDGILAKAAGADADVVADVFLPAPRPGKVTSRK